MHTTAIKVFFGTLLMFVPAKVLAQPETQAVRRLSSIQQSDRHSLVQLYVWNLPASLTIKHSKQYLKVQSVNDDLALTSGAFQAGKTSWQGKTKLGLMKLDGNFDSSAQLTKGKAFLSAPIILGSVNLAIDLNDRVQPIKTVTNWQTNTPLGSLAIQGNFSQEVAFTGGNVAWNADTPLGALIVRGDFDRNTSFSGGNTAWNTKTRIGTVTVRGNFDGDTNFSGGNAA